MLNDTIGNQKNDIAAKKINKFKSLGYETLCGFSFEEAWKLLLSNPKINLLIIDIDSFGDIEIFVKDLLSIRNIPIMYLTSKTEKDLVEKFDNTACYGYLHGNSDDFIFNSTIKVAFNLFKKHEKLEKQKEQLKKREREHQNIFKNHHAIMLIINPETGDIIQANPAMDGVRKN